MIIILNLLIILVSLLQKYKKLDLKTPIEMMQKFVLALLSVALTISLPQAQSQSETVVDVDDGAGSPLAPTGCCDWPSCYDERTDLCLDTCLMTWSQCPKKLFLMSCYSEFISPFGALPLQCFPDVVNHIDQAELRGLTGSTKQIRDKLHESLNIKTCHPRTGICRPN